MWRSSCQEQVSFEALVLSMPLLESDNHPLLLMMAELRGLWVELGLSENKNQRKVSQWNVPVFLQIILYMWTDLKVDWNAFKSIFFKYLLIPLTSRQQSINQMLWQNHKTSGICGSRRRVEAIPIISFDGWLTCHSNYLPGYLRTLCLCINCAWLESWRRLGWPIAKASK